MPTPLDSWEPVYSQYRPYLLSVAFRMLGSLSDAEDIVQDTFLECQKIPPSHIKSHKAWLTKICSNKAINHLKSAYKRREVYPGTWLPDEIPDGLQQWSNLAEEPSPEKHLVLAESLTTSFLLLIEKLTPEQRVIFLLNEIFDYSFKEISGFLGKGAPSCRKIAQRAREAIASEKVKFSPPPANAEKIIFTFYEHAKNGDRESLTKMLSKDSELWGDGGGKVFAAGHITDFDKAIDFLQKMGRSEYFHSHRYKMEYYKVNSRPGMVISKQLTSGFWALDTILSFEFYGDTVARIYAQRNPDKLKMLL